MASKMFFNKKAIENWEKKVQIGKRKDRGAEREGKSGKKERASEEARENK